MAINFHCQFKIVTESRTGITDVMLEKKVKKFLALGLLTQLIFITVLLTTTSHFNAINQYITSDRSSVIIVHKNERFNQERSESSLEKSLKNGDDRIKVFCPTDLVIHNGIANFSEDGKSVTFHCDDNFKIIGSESAECQQNKTWSSPLPKCIAPCPSDLVIPKGYVKYGEDSKSLTYHCDDNFKIIGSDSAECHQNGTWSSPLPKCIASCPTDLVIPNGYVKLGEDSRSVTYECANNFKLNGSDSAVCQQNGTWSLPLPTCIARCPTNLKIPNGYLKFGGDKRSVTYQCAKRFKLVGASSAECKQDGTWSSPPPKCVTVFCPTEMVIPNGNVKISKDGRSVTYQCADKFKLVGSASAECQRNETWSSPLPKCKVVSQGCQTSYRPNKLTEIAEHVAADPFELRYIAKHCKKIFYSIIENLSNSTNNHLCQKFAVSNLTSTFLQQRFLRCTGLMLYRYLLDAEGNVKVPKPFHNCKKMSFRDSGIPTLLVSYPGSGNSWVRQLLESATGIYTGADRDCDLDYIKYGMLGEGVSSKNVLAIKFHFGPLPIQPFKKVIYIIRNPYDAFVAEYRRSLAAGNAEFRTEFNANPHTSTIGDEIFGTHKWDFKVWKFINEWKAHIYRWLGPKIPGGATILVVKYENLKSDLRTELKRMIDYLEYPYTDKDLDCAITSDTNAFQRHHDHENKEHFSQDNIDLIYSTIKTVDVYLKKYNITYEKHVAIKS